MIFELFETFGTLICEPEYTKLLLKTKEIQIRIQQILLFEISESHNSKVWEMCVPRTWEIW